MLNREFAIRQTKRMECFEGFPKLEWNETAFGEYVTALQRCQTEQHCREVVTHFVETATKSPTVAVVLAQVRISAPPAPRSGKKCQDCTDGWKHGHYLVEGPGSTPQEISGEEAADLLVRIKQTKNCRSMVYEGVRKCHCQRPSAAVVVIPKERSFSDFYEKQ